MGEDGESALLQLMNEGVRFRADGVFTKQVLRQLVSKAQKQFQEAER